ncbi:MAG: hypothetical protein HUU08_14565 [Candidatus Brocadia sp.]|nr:hypothetical protein [Candidatus Brocadia sp.]
MKEKQLIFRFIRIEGEKGMSFRKKTNINKFQFWFSTKMLAVSADDMAQTALELIRKPCISPSGYNFLNG